MGQSTRAYPDAASLQLELTYRRPSLIADYLRAGSGLALTAVPLLVLDPAWPVMLALVALLALFAVFLAQTRRQQLTCVSLTAEGIMLRARTEQRLRWGELDGVRLRWFGSRRQGRGWLDLELTGGGERLVVTSALDRFETVVAAALDAARRNRLTLEPATGANVTALLGRTP